jgi:hypothetical protein
MKRPEERERLLYRAQYLGLAVVRSILFLGRITDSEIRLLLERAIRRDAQLAARAAVRYLEASGLSPLKAPTTKRKARLRQKLIEDVGRIKLLDLWNEDFEENRTRKRVSPEGPPGFRQAARMIENGLDGFLRARR